MNKDVIISVRGIQTSPNDKEANQMELVTEGKYYKKGNSYYITYKESKVTGMEGTTTMVKVCEDGLVTLIRFGTVNTQFMFKEGKKYTSYYDTMYGTFIVDILTKTVSIDVDDRGGDIRVDYNIAIDDNKRGETDFYIKIREVAKGQ
ncbi:MAG: DUF1934 domain-containing protein [Clostridiales bacterium]|nr:DUF1934 domain-containing protein [Clostridiales bacterium]